MLPRPPSTLRSILGSDLSSSSDLGAKSSIFREARIPCGPYAPEADFHLPAASRSDLQSNHDGPSDLEANFPSFREAEI